MIARLTELAGRRTRRVLILAGVVFVAAAAIGGPVVGALKSQNSDFQDPAAQNQRALHAIERATSQSAEYGVAALVPSAGVLRPGAPSSAPAAAPAVRVAAALAAQPGFQRVLDYPASGLPALVSRDGRETLVLAAFRNRDDSARAVERARRSLTGLGVRFGGNDVAFHEINKRVTSDLKRAEMFAFPILLALSFWVFRGLIAALLPLLVGGFAIVLTFLALRAIDQLVGMSVFAVNLVTGMGLGLGIDYSLFVLARYREELATGADSREAIGRTLQTAGRTVAYSALTVAGALSSLLVFPLRFLYSMGVGGSLVALADGAVALVVLPAVLIALGPSINALAPARLQRSAARTAKPAEHGAWFRLASAVTRRPGAVTLATAAALIALALPSLRLTLAPADARVLPSSSEPRQVGDALTRDFAVNGSQSVTLVVRAPGGEAGRAAVATLARSAQSVAGGGAGVGPSRYLGRGVWEIDMIPRGAEAAPANQRLVKRLRAIGAPRTLLVGGPTAWFVDQKSAIASNLAPALVILVLATGGVLFLMTGSLLLPVMALAMNVLTVGVGAGLLVLVFQEGNLSSLFGFTTVGGLEEANLVLLFVVAFALSTDYGVFLYSRIKEAHEQGLAARAAVAYGLERTGRLVTAAALLFCVAIGAFVTSDIFFIKQLGLGAALAVAIDATVVRALLVPALMGWLGERAWWAPRPLRRLHSWVGLRESMGAHA